MRTVRFIFDSHQHFTIYLQISLIHLSTINMTTTIVKHFINEISCNNESIQKFRDNIRNKYKDILEVQSDAFVINIERGVFNSTLDKCTKMDITKCWSNVMFVEVYFRTLHFVFRILNNQEIRKKLFENEITPQQLAFMTHQDIEPEKWKILIQQKNTRDKHMFQPKVQASTDSYTCRRCRSKECTYYQMQTRSADEPMTLFVSCINCGNQWKQ